MFTGIETIEQRLYRLRGSAVGIMQGTIAAGGAFWLAKSLFGHQQAFFAPMAAVIVLGLTGGDRLRRAVELNIGVTLGVGMGDLVISHLGTGTWQLTLVVFASLVLAVFVDKGPLVHTQAAVGSVLIATIMPPGTSGGMDRMLDAFIGGLVGLLVIALLPTSPLRGGRQEIAKVLGTTADVLRGVAQGLHSGNVQNIQTALADARGTQGTINNMIAAAKVAKESITVSPLLWRTRRRVRTLVRILNPVDNAIRNTRVLARRAVVLGEDRDDVSPQQLDIIVELADITARLSDLYSGTKKIEESTEIPLLVHRLRVLGNRAGLEVAEGRVLSAQVILAQTRSLIVDLLQICGMSRHSAVAVLRPTSEHPAMPPELREEDEDPTGGVR